MWSKNENPDAEDNLHEFIAVALGIDGTVEEVFGTYINFFNLLKSNYNLVDASDKYSDELLYVDFLNGSEVVQTLQLPEKVWALLLSEPEIFEIARDARIRPSYLRDGLKYYTNVGWTYINVDGEYEVNPPENWLLPDDAHITDQEKREIHIVKLNEVKDRYLNSHPINQEMLAKIEKEIERLG
jgi:hypothetical protein